MAAPFRLLYPLLASLVLLFGACKKSDPAAEPVLEGSWDFTSLVNTGYTHAGVQLYKSVIPYPTGNDVNARHLTITSTTMQVIYNNTAVSDPASTYTRSGSTITITSANPVETVTITQLTAIDLTLLSRENPPPFNYNSDDYILLETHYTRR